MSAILALPPPQTSTPSTFARARALVASDALPVTPIKAVPDEERRRQLRQAVGEDERRTGDAPTHEVGALKEGARRPGDRDAAGREDTAGLGSEQRPEARSRLATLDSGANAGFVAQSLHQEALGSGLHIEPWGQALRAYAQADSSGVPKSRLGLTL